jgi:hypothetical protein
MMNETNAAWMDTFATMQDVLFKKYVAYLLDIEIDDETKLLWIKELYLNQKAEYKNEDESLNWEENP